MDGGMMTIICFNNVSDRYVPGMVVGSTNRQKPVLALTYVSWEERDN